MSRKKGATALGGLGGKGNKGLLEVQDHPGIWVHPDGLTRLREASEKFAKDIEPLEGRRGAHESELDKAQNAMHDAMQKRLDIQNDIAFAKIEGGDLQELEDLEAQYGDLEKNRAEAVKLMQGKLDEVEKESRAVFKEITLVIVKEVILDENGDHFSEDFDDADVLERVMPPEKAAILLRSLSEISRSLGNAPPRNSGPQQQQRVRKT